MDLWHDEAMETWEVVILWALAVASAATAIVAIVKPASLFPPMGKRITKHDMLVSLVGRTGARIFYIVFGFGLSATLVYLLTKQK